MNRAATGRAGDQPRKTGWRVRVGFAIFVASIGWPVLIPILPLLGVSGTAIATFSGAMLVAAEFMTLAGAAIAGKDGFAFIKAKVFGFLKFYGPPKTVSRIRYSIGLVMFVAPLLLGWASPYFGHHIPGFKEHTMTYAVGGDVLLVISLLVLGGDFWDKLQSLIVHDATAVIPARSAAHGSAH